MKIILATRNPSKAEQIRALFVGMSIEILSLDDAGIVGEEIEDGTTLEENATKKAVYAHERSGAKFWTMSDDTGLFIDALSGEPGIQAANWAGPNKTTEEKLAHALKQLEGVKDRSATFETVAVLISPEGKKYVFNGAVRGTLLEAPRVKSQKSMPYSAIFQVDGQEKVWAEMSPEEENAISHRGIAFRKVKEFLAAQL